MMLSAIVIIAVVCGAFMYNLNRVVRMIDDDAGQSHGYIIGFPMLITTAAAAGTTWLLWWSHQELSSDGVAIRLLALVFGLYFGPVILGIIIRLRTNSEHRADRTKDFE